MNGRKKYSELEKRINRYTLELERIFDTLNAEAARLALNTSYTTDLDEPFLFQKYPETKYGIDKLQEQYVTDIGSLIYRGTSEEWMNSNLACDLLADGVLNKYIGHISKELHTQYYQVNSPVLKAFQQRRDRGLLLSDKLWKQSKHYKEELEGVISVALERGTSAITLSKRISKYLKDFPSIQKDYKEKYGKAATIYDCEYRSARLARTEINMAYRTAEQTRWKQMDFVIGYEVKLSNNHNCKGVPRGQFYDICDELAGKYPKDFKFRGWHPNCRCFTIPILKTEEEFFGDLPGKGEVTDVPDKFKQWMNDNAERYEKAKERGTLPYFVRDNKKYIEIRKEEKSKRKLDVEKVKIAYKDRLLKKSKKKLNDYSDYQDFINERVNFLNIVRKTDLTRGQLRQVLDDFDRNIDLQFQEWVNKRYTTEFTVNSQESYEKVMDMMGRATKNVWSKTPLVNKTAFVDYTFTDSYDILSDIGKGIYNAKAEKMIEVLNSIKTTEDLVLRSGQKESILRHVFGEDFLKTYRTEGANAINKKYAGHIGVNKSFMSTSFNEDGGLVKDIELQIFAPSGTSCINLNEISQFGRRINAGVWNGYDFEKQWIPTGESEFLLQQGYRMKFVKAVDGVGINGKTVFYVQLLNRVK